MEMSTTILRTISSVCFSLRFSSRFSLTRVRRRLPFRLAAMCVYPFVQESTSESYVRKWLRYTYLYSTERIALYVRNVILRRNSNDKERERGERERTWPVRRFLNLKKDLRSVVYLPSLYIPLVFRSLARHTDLDFRVG